MLGDEQLAKRVSAGNREAFSALYDRHLPALVRYCRGILLHAQDAEDAAQSAMIAALRSLPGRPPQLKVQAWLFRVAHNEAISILRRRRSHSALEQAMEIPSIDTADTAAARARWNELVTDLRALPERQRSALLLRELSGLDYNEVAGALDCSESAAMQTVFEARATLMQFQEGRAMTCTGVQTMLSGGDRRTLRARRVRAHMRSCDNCRTFALSIKRRRSDFALLFPVVLAKPSVFLGLLGGLGAGRGSRAAALVLRAQSASPAVRSAAAVVVVAAGGATAAHVAQHVLPGPGSPHASDVARALPGHPPGPSGATTAAAITRVSATPSRITLLERAAAQRGAAPVHQRSSQGGQAGKRRSAVEFSHEGTPSAAASGAPTPARLGAGTTAGGGTAQVGTPSAGAHVSLGAVVQATTTGADVTVAANVGPGSPAVMAGTSDTVSTVTSLAGSLQHVTPSACVLQCH